VTASGPRQESVVQQGVIILGMHRSGTSAVAATMRLLGADLGPSLMPAHEAENPKGFFEHVEIVQCHERLLAALGRGWDDPRSISKQCLATGSAQDARQELTALLRRDFGDSALWAVKDPRVCRLVPLWLQILEDLESEPRFIIVHRPLVEVAASLRRRNGFSAEKSALLWADHVMSAEFHTRRHRRAFVSYDRLLRDTEGTLREVGEALGLEWTRAVSEAMPHLSEFLCPSLRHFTTGDPSLPSDYGRLSPIVDPLDKFLSSIGVAGDRIRTTPFDNARPQLTRMLSNIDSVLLEHATQLIGRATTAPSDLQEQLDERTEWLRKHQEQLDERDESARDHETRISELGTAVQKLHDLLSQADQSGLQEQLEGQAASSREHDHRISELGTAVRELQDLVNALAARLDDTVQQSMRALATRLDEQDIQITKQADATSRLHESIEALRAAVGDQLAEAGKTPQELQRVSAVAGDLDLRLRDAGQRLDRQESQLGGIGSSVHELEDQLNERTEWLRIQDTELNRVRETVLVILQRIGWPGVVWHARRTWELVRRGAQSSVRGGAVLVARSRALWQREVAPRIEGLQRSRRSMIELKPLDQERIKRIRLPREDSPLVSIVIPVYNQVDHTVRCLESIAKVGGEASFEVILVDDCSTDSTIQLCRGIRGLRLVRNNKNLGFIHSCNKGAAAARGRYLLFLNNDTTVTEGWLDRMVETFETFRDVGAVGAKLVYPDGRIQEAGGIVWRDGSACNYGWGMDPDTPECNYAREVDYCSGACLMVPKELWCDVGMFDTRYAPAYYEDTDLAFRLREKGKRVIYQSAAVVHHCEGATAGTSTNSGVKQHQVENQQRFYERWQQVLRHHRPNADLPELEKERHVERRALIIDHRLPTPDRDSGSLRMFNLVQIIRDLGFKVTFLPENLLAQQPYLNSLTARGIEVIRRPFEESVLDHLEGRGHLYELVILSRLNVASQHIRAVRRLCPNALVVYDTVDLHFLRESREADLDGDEEASAKARETKEVELAVAAAADVTLVVSTEEKRLLGEVAPGLDVHVVSNIHHPRPPTRPFRPREGILFVGGFEHPPNTDAVRWFANEVMPIVRRLLPGVQLFIVGSNPPEEVHGLESDDITVTGYVPDLDSYFDTCRLSVAPLRFGAGVKGKVNQSLACGLPCVSTTIGAEGMHLEPGIDILIADKPEAFAEAVVHLYHNQDVWEKLSAGGLRNIEKHFSVEVARRAMENVLSSHPARAARSTQPQ
jgi:GT2 family glycosyltransferase